ncbi:MAG: hypothetical protein KDK70_34550 [Myxococcales bacterium]|nr:hypothetical protein [Myxococcales bacterium]
MSEHELGHYAADGGVVIAKGGRICVAPPAQAATTVKLELDNKAKAGVKDIVDLELGSTLDFNETLHTLYEQGQATLFLQFMAYRLCEASLNHEIDKQTYLSELDKINEIGRDLLGKELQLAKERTQTKEASAKEASAKVEAKAQELLADPSTDADTRKSLLKSLEDRAEADKAEAEAGRAEAEVEALELQRLHK